MNADLSNFNDMSRLVTMSHAIAELIPVEQKAAALMAEMGSDNARFARLLEHIGDVAHTMQYGTVPLEDKLLAVAASAEAWILSILEAQAA